MLKIFHRPTSLIALEAEWLGEDRNRITMSLVSEKNISSHSFLNTTFKNTLPLKSTNRTFARSRSSARILLTWQALWNRKKGASKGSPRSTELRRITEGYSAGTYPEPDRHDPPFSMNLSLSLVKRRKLGLHTIELFTENEKKEKKPKRRRKRDSKPIIGIRAALL